MSLEEALYFAAIMLVGIPASIRWNGRIRNPTAFAMVGTWFVCRLLYWITGEGMPVQAMLLSDFAVLTVIYSKADWHDCSPYSGLRHQFCALWLERSPWDRAILALFPVVWLFYFPIVDPVSQYWALWTLGLVQLMLAGAEALHQHRGQMAIKSRADAPERPPPRSDFHALVRGAGYG